MARKNLLDTIDEVAKGAEIKANTMEMLNIPDDKLIDYPDNNEDISYTEDLETSMKENGFIDPIDVTDNFYKLVKIEKRIEINPEDGKKITIEVPIWEAVDLHGKYMILSGHRRRAAGRKAGYKTLPCIVRHFKDGAEFENFVLMSNANRNSEHEPLIYAKRYKGHENYLRKIGFKGSYMKEIASRMGMSIKSLEKYKQMNKVIMPVWDMVNSGIVGMSSVLFMATFPVEKQEEIYNIFQDNLANGIALTRDKCKEIKKEYELRNTFPDIIEGQTTIETLENGKYMPEYQEEQTEVVVPTQEEFELSEQDIETEANSVEQPDNEKLDPLKVNKLVEQFMSQTQKATRKNVLQEMEKESKRYRGSHDENLSYQMKPGKVSFGFSNVYHTFHSVLNEYEKNGGTFEKELEKVKGEVKEFSNANGEKLMHYLHMVDSMLDEYSLLNTNEAAALSNKINGVIIDLLCELEKIGVNNGLTGHCMTLVKDIAHMADTIYGRN